MINHKGKLWLLSLILTVLSSYSVNGFASEMAIFTLDADFEPLTQTQARKLYRGKTKVLGGKRVELSDWPGESQEREQFYRDLLGKNSAQMNAYWATLSFTGKARLPKNIDDASINSLIQWMNDKPYRIGYAPLDIIPQGANILYVISKEQ